MKRTCLLISLIIVAFTMSSCYDDGYSVGNYGVATATFKEVGDYYYISTDNGWNLYPSVSNISSKAFNDGDRVIVNFTILGNTPENSNYHYFIKVNTIDNILTKNIFVFSDNTSNTVKDSIGNDPVIINDTWFTDDYLNIEFVYRGGRLPHYITLVQDSTMLKNNKGAYILELKHNDNKDPYNYEQWGVASFNLSSLQEKGKESVKIFLRSIKSNGSYGYNQTMVYKYGENVKNEPHTFSKVQTELLLK